MQQPTLTPRPTEYRPALLTGGGVSLGRATRFAALVQALMQDKVDADLARLTDEVDAAVAAGAPEPVATTFDQAMGNVPVGTDTGPARQLPPATGFEIYEAVVNGGWAPRFAAVCVVAVLSDGTVRDVTEQEAASDHFPSRPFAEALESFSLAVAPLTQGLLLTQSATASSSNPPGTAAGATAT